MNALFSCRVLSPSPVRRRAFTLVEVVLAIGVFSFAIMSMVALIPAALGFYRQAAQATAHAHILQSVTTDVQLGGIGSVSGNSYFDAEGSRVDMTSKDQAAAQIYTATITYVEVGQGDTSGSSSRVLSRLQPASANNIAVKIVSRTNPGQTNVFSVMLAN
ncbi:MAG: Verru_Chthon cassette protein B [Candidatus Methylacidiphilales bacterium]|nr:Verru_Chthon cassette protein B [Candidatus Methylacidiphilales bacterium]